MASPVPLDCPTVAVRATPLNERRTAGTYSAAAVTTLSHPPKTRSRRGRLGVFFSLREQIAHLHPLAGLQPLPHEHRRLRLQEEVKKVTEDRR